MAKIIILYFIILLRHTYAFKDITVSRWNSVISNYADEIYGLIGGKLVRQRVNGYLFNLLVAQ